jgi:dUTP pyrophosphatase
VLQTGGNMLLKVARTHNMAKLPSRANPSDAGADVFYCPTKVVSVELQPGESAVLPTGLKVEVPHGYMLEVKNRSGMAAKNSLVVGACVVDSGYSGEIFVNLHNIGNTPKTIDMGDKIAQLVLIPVVQWRSFPVEEEMLYVDPLTISNRGDGALGSTGK